MMDRAVVQRKPVIRGSIWKRSGAENKLPEIKHVWQQGQQLR